MQCLVVVFHTDAQLEQIFVIDDSFHLLQYFIHINIMDLKRKKKYIYSHGQNNRIALW